MQGKCQSSQRCYCVVSVSLKWKLVSNIGKVIKTFKLPFLTICYQYKLKMARYWLAFLRGKERKKVVIVLFCSMVETSFHSARAHRSGCLHHKCVLLQVWQMLKNACRVCFSVPRVTSSSCAHVFRGHLSFSWYLTTVTSSKTGADGVKCCSGPHADQTGASSQYLVCNRSLNSDPCYLRISGFSCILHVLKICFSGLLTFIMLFLKDT